MLQFLHEKAKGVTTWIIVLLVAGAFALWGLSDYFAGSHQRAIAARVNGEPISWQMVDMIYERSARQYGREVDQKSLKEQVRNALVRRAALITQARKLGYQIGDEQIALLLSQIPAFQVGGKFSKDQYLKVLTSEGFTDKEFRNEVSQDILLGQLEQGVAYSSFTLPSELARLVEKLDQKRDFGFAIIPAKRIQTTAITLTPDEIKRYYETHKTRFVKPEQVVVEYVKLSLDPFIKQVQVSKADALAFYNEHKESYVLPERVHARHILLTVPPNNPEMDKEAKAKIESLQDALKKGGDFAALAKQSSQDPGSAEKGGDLGWFMKGQMVPEFEKAAFELKKPGDISLPLRTQFGYHLIQLVEHKPSETRSFEAVQLMVEEQLKREKAQMLFAEKGEQLARLAFEQGKTLAPIAEKLGLKVEETAPFGREGNPTSKDISASPAIVNMIFTDPSLMQGNNSEPIKLSDTEMAVARVKKHMAAEQQTVQQVEKQVKDSLAFEKGKERAKETGAALLAQIEAGRSPAEVTKNANLDWITKATVARMAPTDIDRNILMEAFRIPPPDTSDKKLSVQGFSLPNGDYVIIAVTKVMPGDLSALPANIKASYLQSLTENTSQFEYAAFVTQALQQAKIELSKKDPTER